MKNKLTTMDGKKTAARLVENDGALRVRIGGQYVQFRFLSGTAIKTVEGVVYNLTNPTGLVAAAAAEQLSA